MLTRRALLALLAVAPLGSVTITGCGSSDARTALAAADVPRDPADPAAGRNAVRAVSAFTADVYRTLAASEHGNLVCSPYSMATALAMTVQGARGNTAEEMLAVLHADSAADLAAGMNALDTALTARSGQAKLPDGSTVEVILDGANSLWGQRGLRWEPAFLDVLARSFGTGMRQVDYRGAPEPAREAINAWVGDQTRDRIPELVPQGVITVDTRLTLVNALYLKAPWRTPFATQATAPAPFTRLDGSTVQADLMHAGLATGYARGPGWAAATLPYADGRLAMTVLVPDAGRFAEVEQSLDGAWLAALFGALRGVEVQLGLPRWTTRSRLSLRPALERLGMRVAFTDRADLTGMTTEEDLLVDAVVHEGFVAVDEAGTEAAAATAVVVGTTSAPAEVVTLTADRPFLYLIHDDADPAVRTPLFIGRVLDPTG